MEAPSEFRLNSSVDRQCYLSPLPEDEQEMLKVIVPEEYHKYIDIFTQKDVKAIPPY